MPRMRATTPSSTSVPACPDASTDIVDTNTSRARKLVSTPTVSCQSNPSGAKTGAIVWPMRPAKLPAWAARVSSASASATSASACAGATPGAAAAARASTPRAGGATRG